MCLPWLFIKLERISKILFVFSFLLLNVFQASSNTCICYVKQNNNNYLCYNKSVFNKNQEYFIFLKKRNDLNVNFNHPDALFKLNDNFVSFSKCNLDSLVLHSKSDYNKLSFKVFKKTKHNEIILDNNNLHNESIYRTIQTSDFSKIVIVMLIVLVVFLLIKRVFTSLNLLTFIFYSFLFSIIYIYSSKLLFDKKISDIYFIPLLFMFIKPFSYFFFNKILGIELDLREKIHLFSKELLKLSLAINLLLLVIDYQFDLEINYVVYTVVIFAVSVLFYWFLIAKSVYRVSMKYIFYYICAFELLPQLYVLIKIQ